MDALTQSLIQMMVLSMAVAAVSVTITLSKIAAPFRKQVRVKSSFLGDLTSCPYCFSHWGSMVAVLIFQPRFTHTHWLLDYLVAIFAMVSMASWYAYIIIHTYGKHKEN